jgi:hypothetical protein
VRTSLPGHDSTFTPFRAHGCSISESDAKQIEGVGVGDNRAPWQISDMVSSSADRFVPEATDPPPEVPVAARTFTFTELQALIEQGKTDEIPNNKQIPDALNVGLTSYSVTW